MKTNKLLAAGALALSMAMTPVASLLNAMPIAAETVDNKTNHAYKAYQVFSGTQAPNDAALGQVEWGAAIDQTKVQSKLEGSDTFKSAKGNAGEVAKILANNQSAADEFAKIVSASLNTDAQGVDIAAGATEVTLDAGYYLLVDQTDTDGKNDYKNLSLLQVTNKGEIEIKKKNDIPSVDKKVQDETTENGQNVTDTDGFYYNADHAIGEEFKFQLTGTVPANTMNLYDSYAFQFNDTLSNGVDFVMDTTEPTKLKGLSIMVTNGDDGTAVNKTDDFTVGVSGKTLIISTNNLKDLVTNPSLKTTVVVTYTAVLNDKAAVTEVGADKTFTENNKVNLEYSNNPNSDGSGKKGKTQDETVFVGTYKLPNTKTDQDGKPLGGAKFKLRRGEGSSAEYAVIEDGKVTGWTTLDNEPKTVITSDASTGDFSVSGLDAGNYVLVEVEAPAGYTKAADTPVTITANHDEGKTDKTKNTKVSVSLTVDSESASFVTVKNNKGGTLPETGGMGTTMIYGVGAVMVAGAAVFYVTNKRTRKD
ncbi:isopeptide-forming domain-containing fimbrial protein [Faecalibaculum rodentium]|uniref:isopeptide-forming domain-containing fimbrial protein n=1 Tax=Faecalibaculum rodentium TaxID=1702221 RepID=UPI0023F120A3|nr:isopeptide-forming domain-containing fimbrial protein [Faecalibaculum rodentium]